MKTTAIFFLLAISAFQLIQAQTAVTDIYTDYKGWWVGSSSIKPDTSHNLLGFKMGTTVYSTGIDDAKLSANNITYIPLEFKSFPASSGIVFGYIGVGFEYGGAGNVNPIPVVNNPGLYLSDGLQGLDLGTALFNSTGTITYTTSAFDPLFIGDGAPDIIVTQVGDPSNLTDKFKFIDLNGVTVGQEVSVVFGNIPKSGAAKWKFYDANLQYASISGGSRDIRLVGYELSDFGINVSNYTDIVSFVHVLSGTSDQAFVAYNKKTITVLPIELLQFSATCAEDVQLNWTTATEENVHQFEIYRSRDGVKWDLISTVKAIGNSSTTNSYTTTDKAAIETQYYKLRSVDNDGKTQDFSPISVVCANKKNTWSIHPVPVASNSTLTITATESTTATLTLLDVNGKMIRQKELMIKAGVNNFPVDIRNLARGTYFFHLENDLFSNQLIKFVKID